MDLSLNLYLNFHFFIFTVFAFISFVANEDQKCTIGRLDDCPSDQMCLQYDSSQTIGQCVCRNGCANGNASTHSGNTSDANPLPIYSKDNSNHSSVIISGIFGTLISVMIITSIYYFGVRRGLIRDIWRRTFTQRQFEHQLLDRNPQTDDNNDTEAIA